MLYVKQKHESDPVRKPIAHDMFWYFKLCINVSLQTVRNCSYRIIYLNKISDHANSLMSLLTQLDNTNVAAVQHLAGNASTYRNAMLSYAKQQQSGPSSWFMKLIKEKKWKFSDLVGEYQTTLGYKGAFKDLPDVRKIKVYEKIIEASGRGRALASKAWKVLGKVGLALMVVTAGMMVWDVFTSSHPIETATRDAVMIAASVGGAALGKIVAAAMLAQVFEYEAPALLVAGLGFTIGIAGILILGAAGALLCDMIFGHGEDGNISAVEGIHCYVAPMPDAAALARQLIQVA